MVLLVDHTEQGFAGGIEYGDDRPQFMYDWADLADVDHGFHGYRPLFSRIIFSSMI